SLGCLESMDDVEDDLALVDLDLVVGELAALGVAAPDAEMRVVAHDDPEWGDRLVMLAPLRAVRRRSGTWRVRRGRTAPSGRPASAVSAAPRRRSHRRR